MILDLHIFFTWLFFIADFFLRLYFSYRILQRRLPVGTSWAWLGLVLLFPLVGTILYLYLGEYRLSPRRRIRRQIATEIINEVIQARFPESTSASPQAALNEASRSIELITRSLFQSPLLTGNNIELLNNADVAFPQMIADIDAAQVSCDMEFYIWSDRGRADEFGQALIRAVKRGVRVRVLVDGIGSAAFLKGAQVVELRSSGVEVRVALPSGLLRSLFARPDLRIHRKILVVDGSIGYTGSLNLADPIYFNKKAGVGQWVDALCRVRGPAVEALGMVFLVDWCIEAGTDFRAEQKKMLFRDISAQGAAQIQCLPSGPAVKESAIEQVLITAIYAARRELTLTTPYFVPSEAFLYALNAAARRGVTVTLIVPARVDSALTQHASQAFLKDLHEAGVNVALFKGGLLHTKSVVIDGECSLFGSLNLDPRSLRINFEITLAIYDKDFARSLQQLQGTYLQNSQMYAEIIKSRVQILKDDLARLLSPLL